VESQGPVLGIGHGGMEREEIIRLAREVAAQHGLDPGLVCAVCEQESGWDPWAIRYEPIFYERYLRPMVDGGELSDATEARARAFSWGLMQVMGQTARENGYSRHMAGICEPETGLEVGCRVLAGKLAEARGDVERGLLLWNGGADTAYPAEVLARRGKYAG
jgi:soluble lytic murein transglycosylase-like protein